MDVCLARLCWCATGRAGRGWRLEVGEEVGVGGEFGEGFAGECEGLWLGLCCCHFGGSRAGRVA